MDNHMKTLTANLEMNPPATAEALKAVEAMLVIEFPDQYKDFLLLSNGSEGSIGENSYLVIWPIEEIVKRNDGYAVSEFVPELVYFGSNGGGSAFAFDKREKMTPIVKFPFDSIDIVDAKLLGNTFIEFLENISNS
jgi:hypothetical protein